MPETLGTFDRIMVTAAMEDIPQVLLGRLEPDGILIAPVGPMDDRQVLTRVVDPAAASTGKSLWPCALCLPCKGSRASCDSRCALRKHAI